MSGDAALGGREILVTGGAGFVGSHLVRRLVRDGARVTVLTQPGAPIAALAEVAGRVTLVEGDLVESASLEQAIGLLAPEVVFHLAAWTGGRSRPDDPGAWRLSLRVNLEGTLNLLVSLAAGRTRPKRIVRTGGMEEYGAGPAPFREEQREHAVSPTPPARSRRPRSRMRSRPSGTCRWSRCVRPSCTAPGRTRASFCPRSCARASRVGTSR